MSDNAPVAELKVKITLTDIFFQTEAISKATVVAENRPETVIKTWAAIMRRCGQNATNRVKTIVIQKSVELEERYTHSLGFTALVAAGMVVIDDSAVGSELSDEHFEQFWKVYPFRVGENGKPIRCGKQNAKVEFRKNIRTKKAFDLLLAACKNYEAATKFRKDPERFLRKEFWKDFVETNGDGSAKTVISSADVQNKREDLWKKAKQ